MTVINNNSSSCRDNHISIISPLDNATPTTSLYYDSTDVTTITMAIALSVLNGCRHARWFVMRADGKCLGCKQCHTTGALVFLLHNTQPWAIRRNTRTRLNRINQRAHNIFTATSTEMPRTEVNGTNIFLW